MGRVKCTEIERLLSTLINVQKSHFYEISEDNSLIPK